jgi:hypothetical protein
MTERLQAALRRAATVPVRAEDYAEIARAVEARRRRRRAGRVAVAAAGLAAVVTLSTVLWASAERRPPRVPDVAASASPSFDGGNAVRVPGVAVGTGRRYSVTFLDGSVAEVTVPAAAGLDAMPARPSGGARLPGVADRDFVVPGRGIAWFASLGTRTRELARGGGKVVSLWDVARPAGGPARYLTFEFGSWVVGVWDGAGGSTMSDADLQAWADNLDGRTTPDGFLVLTAKAPLELLGPGSGAAPSLTWGDEGSDGLTVRLEPCVAGVDESAGTGGERVRTLCQPGWRSHVEIRGSAAFVDAASTTVDVRPGA